MTSATARFGNHLQEIVAILTERLETLALVAAPPMLRIALALPFLRSGFTRWDGFLSLSAGTIYLFENQFKLHIFGHLYAFPIPDITALIVAVAEIVLPTLLLLGLTTRLAGAALFVMTGVIQLVFPDGWANYHLYWASMGVAIIALGPGPVSLDYLVGRWLREKNRVIAQENHGERTDVF